MGSTGFVSVDSKHKAFEERFGGGGGGGAEAMPDIGIGRYSSLADHDHRFLSFCKVILKHFLSLSCICISFSKLKLYLYINIYL